MVADVETLVGAVNDKGVVVEVEFLQVEQLPNAFGQWQSDNMGAEERLKKLEEELFLWNNIVYQ